MKPTDPECPWLEKVSAAFDGELEENERIATNEHLQTCEVCRGSLEELSEIRAALQSIPLHTPANPVAPAQTKVRGRIFSAALAATFAGMLLGGSAVFLVQQSGRVLPEPVPAVVDRGEAGEPVGLSRFDHGERAMIFKAPKNALPDDPGDTE